MSNNPNNWPLWEIFIQSKRGLEHKHVGSLHAADPQMAIENARDVYTRRQEGNSIWVVLAEHVHRHPTFYTMPEGAKYI
jgi:ring-1,2-phenylacetyl-CoA epoxidase subunit PaaB